MESRHMEITVGSVVRSLAGRDANRMFIVVGKDSLFASIADGRLRRAEKPKRKKLKHLQWVAEPDAAQAGRLRTEGRATNSEIRRMLLQYEPDADSRRQTAATECKGRNQEVE